MKAIRRISHAMLLLGLLFACTAFAQNYPARPVTFIVPWPPGGTTDLSMRALAVIAEKHLGQRVAIKRLNLKM